jgi:hypothetical protein
MINVPEKYRLRNWGGEDEKPITSEAIVVAENFLKELGADPPYHEIGFLHDGTICFDFMKKVDGMMIMLMITAELSGNLTFAYLNNKEGYRSSGVIKLSEFNTHELKKYTEVFR